MKQPQGPGFPAVERRSGKDRRRPPEFPPQFPPAHRRRRSGRRRTDEAGYIDIYDPRSCAIATAVLALSLLDALLTALHLQGGRFHEANPLMRFALEVGGTYTFFSVKTAMTALPMAIILIHQEWRLARVAAWTCLYFYVVLTLYHFYLILFHTPVRLLASLLH